jgi:hypothetical protein
LRRRQRFGLILISDTGILSAWENVRMEQAHEGL